jgi:hypothetical protein
MLETVNSTHTNVKNYSNQLQQNFSVLFISLLVPYSRNQTTFPPYSRDQSVAAGIGETLTRERH